MTFDYKKYSLEKLEEWVCDVVDGEATADEIVDVIYTSVKNSIEYHEKCLNRSKNILNKLGDKVTGTDFPNKIEYEEIVAFEKQQSSWTLPVDDDGVITFPEDFIKRTGWKEGDVLNWIDQKDGSFILKKSEEN